MLLQALNPGPRLPVRHYKESLGAYGKAGCVNVEVCQGETLTGRLGPNPQFSFCPHCQGETLTLQWIKMNRPFEFAVGEYYHLYQRGNEKRKVFMDAGDYWRFLSLLYLTNTTQAIHLSDLDPKDKAKIFSYPKKDALVAIGAYCLMPNHFHLLVKEIRKDGVSRFMQKLITAYSMYFNKKNQRTGALFEGPFRAKHVSDDRQLEYLYAYIHLNPVKIKDPEGWAGKRIANPTLAEENLSNYRFSSYSFYHSGDCLEKSILTPKVFPGYFGTKNDFDSLLREWINFDE